MSEQPLLTQAEIDRVVDLLLGGRAQGYIGDPVQTLGERLRQEPSDAAARSYLHEHYCRGWAGMTAPRKPDFPHCWGWSFRPGAVMVELDSRRARLTLGDLVRYARANTTQEVLPW